MDRKKYIKNTFLSQIDHTAHTAVWLEASFFTVVHLSIGTSAIKRRWASGLISGDKHMIVMTLEDFAFPESNSR